MIDFINVSKSRGTAKILREVSFRINPGERVGIVGPNGAGKSTLFSLMDGEISSDKGEVILPKNTRLGHLHQQLHAYSRDVSLIDYAIDSIPDLKTIAAKMRKLEKQLRGVDGDEEQKMVRQLGELQHRYEHLGGYKMRIRAEAALGGLGFKNEEFEKPFADFSGGWQMRAELVRTLIAYPDILLLDEPANYLDLPAIEWLQNFLRGFEGTMLLISHDRYLLESLTDQTLEVSGGVATKYSGAYAHYIKARKKRREQELAAWKNYQKKKAHLESFIERFRAKATKAAQVQSRVKMLEKMEVVRRPLEPPASSNLRIAKPPRSGAHVMRIDKLSFSYDGDNWLFRDLNLDIQKGQKIAIVGYNGMGKTTLLRLLAGVLKPTRGTRAIGHNVVLGYQSQDFSETMPPSVSVLGVVRRANRSVSEGDVRNLLGSFGFSGDSVEKPVEVLSGGEKIRLALARIFINPPNFLILDEPTTNLDIQGREALEKAIQKYSGTLCMVSHDTSFVRNTAQEILSINAKGVSLYSGGYDYYLEKSAAREQQIGTPSANSESSSQERRSLSSREKRQLRARQRKARKGLKKLEREIEQLHKDQRDIQAEMARSDIEIDYAKLNIKLDEISTDLAEVEGRWLEEAERLDL